ncbi:MAG: hypothetical protein JWP97_374 [Labilithrix sp.]|nr:hypothetical protein [Labilithrix sp.]
MARIDWDFVRAVDWRETPLGDIASWPKSLVGLVRVILEMPTPAIVFWGPELTQIYNDGYAVIMGPRHPEFFGRSYRDAWPETYSVLHPEMRKVLGGGVVEITPGAPIWVARHGFLEEAYFSFSFSPVRDDEGRIAGIFQPVTEHTGAVLRDRRTETLRLLSGAQGDDVLPRAAAALSANPADVPAFAIYLWNEAEERLDAFGSGGLRAGSAGGAELASVASDLHEAFASGAAREVAIDLAAGPWPEPIRRAYVGVLRRASGDAATGVVLFGISPRLRFDASYRAFFDEVAREVGSSLAAVRRDALEAEWRVREANARREAEAVKEANARRVAMLFEHAPVGIAVLRGPEHVFEVANPQYHALTGNRPLLNLTLREALPDITGQGIFELVERVYRTGEPFVGHAVRIVLDGGDGTTREGFFDFVYEPVPGEDGATETIIVVVFDVTELARARRDAEAANRAKDEFFAMLGHELRNPLAPIATALELMRLRGDAANAKERTVIEHQVEQIRRLVDDLLDVSRITRGKVSLKRQPVEMMDLVTVAIEAASPLVEERRHHLEVDVPGAGLVVDGDPSRLAQVISNLLTNAAKYTEPGGRIRVAAHRAGDRVLLSVKDSGIGIAPDMLPRVFEPFAQEEQALDRAQGGLGLGLAIVSNLVVQHGGSVRVESDGPGHGSTFTIELPASDAVVPVKDASPVTTPPEDGARKIRVLVVDDNEDAAELLAEALAMLGYDTRVAYDGAAALRLHESYAPDVALLDIGLPVMTGYELAGRLRSAPGGDVLKLVAVTGYGQDADRARTREAGFDAHLVKPVLVDTLGALLAGYRAGITAET